MTQTVVKQPLFSTRVTVPLAPINDRAYRLSAGGVWKLILMEEEGLKKIYDPELLSRKMNKIDRLRKIIEDLRKAREIYENH